MSDPKIQILVREGEQRLSRHVLADGDYLIGRGVDCAIRIVLEGVSHHHARLRVTAAGGMSLEDLGSTNGTFVDGVRTSERIALQAGQLVEVATAVLEFREPGPDSSVGSDVALAPGNATTMDSRPGEPVEAVPDGLLPGNYVVGGEVARGGMGAVLYAKDLNIRRSVAMKVILPDKVRTARNILRFIEEAQVTGQLEHPNIMPIHELGRDEQGRLYYTMKYVKGVTLQDVLDEIVRGKRAMIQQYSLPHLLTIFEKICDAIAFAHSKGVVHRDLKPENIMLGEYGEVLVMDWGLAKILTPTGRNPEEARWVVQSTRIDSGDANLTLDGVVMGTPHFMAPEQAAGVADQIDVRTDLFALGGILYNILTLTPPFPGATADEAMRRVRAGKVAHPINFNRAQLERRKLAERAGAYPAELLHYIYEPIPESLAAVAMKALEAKKLDRYQTVKEMQQDVAAYERGFATEAERASAFKHLLLWIKRRKVEALVILASVAVISTLGTGAIQRILTSERLATETLKKLHATGPQYYELATRLMAQRKPDQALQRITTAILLAPDEPIYHHLRGDILESLLRLSEARDAYARAWQLNPNDDKARENLNLCERLLKQNQRWKELLPTSLFDLYLQMRKENRLVEAAEIQARLRTDPPPFYQPIKAILEKIGAPQKIAALRLDESGQISLDLSGVAIADLTPLAGLPIADLNLAGTDVSDLTPLKAMPLTQLNLRATSVTDLSPLVGLPLQGLDIADTFVTDLGPLRGMPLRMLVLANTPITDLSPLRNLPLQLLRLDDCYGINDLSVLDEAPLLIGLMLPPQVANIGFLCELPRLQRVADRWPGAWEQAASPDEYWRAHPAPPSPAVFDLDDP